MQLKNDKKLLKLYSQNIQLLINSINDNRNSLKKAMKEMDKYSPMDHPFCFLKKFQIIINAYHSYFKIFWGKSQKILEHLNNEVDSNLSMISTFLSNNQLIIENIKLKSEFISKQNEINCAKKSFELLNNQSVEKIKIICGEELLQKLNNIIVNSSQSNI